MNSRILAIVLLMISLLGTVATPRACGQSEVSGSKPQDWSLNLHVVDVTGGTVSVMAITDVQEKFPAWSPDRRRIAFSANVGYGDVFIRDADGSNLTNVTSTPTRSEWHPSWSPDGQWLAYSAQDANESESDIIVRSLSDGSEINLTEGLGKCAKPAWSPDGRMIAFSCSRDGTLPEIYTIDRMDLTLTRLTEVATNARYATEPAWSPEGSRIIYTVVEPSNRDIYVMNADGSETSPLAASPSIEEYPAWSLDGTRIAFVGRDASERHALYVMNVDGSGVSALTDGMSTNELYPTWGPGLHQITFVSFVDVSELGGRGALTIYEGGGIRSTSFNAVDPRYTYATKDANGDWVYTEITEEEAVQLLEKSKSEAAKRSLRENEQ